MNRRNFLLGFAVAPIALALVGCSGSNSSETKGADLIMYSPDHPAFSYTDHTGVSVSSTSARFVRALNDPFGKLHYSSPGSRIRFHTQAKDLTILMTYTGLVFEGFTQNIGLILVDGEIYARYDRAGNTSDLKVEITLDGNLHLVEVLMPYGSSVDFLGIRSSGDISEAPTRTSSKIAFFGDSITQGFNATDLSTTWSYLLASGEESQLLNCGYAGCTVVPEHGAIWSQVATDTAIFAYGVNDYATQVPLDTFKQNVLQWILNYRQVRTNTKLYCVTPLFCADMGKEIALDLYRNAIKEALAELSDENNILVDGLTLTPNNLDDLVDTLHPGSVAQLQMANTLSTIL